MFLCSILIEPEQPIFVSLSEDNWKSEGRGWMGGWRGYLKGLSKSSVRLPHLRILVRSFFLHTPTPYRYKVLQNPHHQIITYNPRALLLVLDRTAQSSPCRNIGNNLLSIPSVIHWWWSGLATPPSEQLHHTYQLYLFSWIVSIIPIVLSPPLDDSLPLTQPLSFCSSYKWVAIDLPRCRRRWLWGRKSDSNPDTSTRGWAKESSRG